MKPIRGISFPFRIGVKGGVVMTQADVYDATHLEESIQQVVATRVGERVMELTGSEVDYQIFEPNDESTHTLLKYEIVDAINKYVKPVKVTMDDIEVYDEEEKVFATIHYSVPTTGQVGTTNTEIGGQI